jgi:hypothetical protein
MALLGKELRWVGLGTKASIFTERGRSGAARARTAGVNKGIGWAQGGFILTYIIRNICTYVKTRRREFFEPLIFADSR